MPIFHFVMPVLAGLEQAEAAPPPAGWPLSLNSAGCDETAALTPLAPGLRLVSVAVAAEPAAMAATMHRMRPERDFQLLSGRLI